MSDAISGLLGGAGLPNVGGAAKQLQQNQTGGQSFENVLQQGGNAPAGEQGNAAASAKQPSEVSAPSQMDALERLRQDHMQRTSHIPADNAKVNALIAEMTAQKTSLGMLKQAIHSVGQKPEAGNVLGRFSQVETEVNQLNALMQSGKEFSQGELLGLQLRVYQVSQHVEVLSKVVDQMTSGIKTILNTNV